MNELILICAVIGVLGLSAVLWPFFAGEGGQLQDAASNDKESDLEARQKAILQRWLKDETALSSGEITQTEWTQRQRYLISRYVDTTRRLGWLRAMERKDGTES